MSFRFSVPGTRVGATKLQQVRVPLIDSDVCNQTDWYNGDLNSNAICAGYEEGGRDSCKVGVVQARDSSNSVKVVVAVVAVITAVITSGLW